jgi:hypothetical protein
MTPEQKRAYVLADNKLAMNTGWDEELLAEELKGLLEIDLDFDIGVTGFSIPEIDSLIDGLAPEEPGNPEEDQLPSIPEGPAAATPRRFLGAWPPSACLRQRRPCCPEDRASGVRLWMERLL